MKNFIWILTAAVIFTHCTNENANKAENQEGVNTEAPAEPGHIAASADSPLVGFWVIRFALGSPKEQGEEIANQYQGRWLNLKGDNTFESGKWQEKNNTGKWNYNAETKIVQLNYANPEPIGTEWKIQGQGDRMVWLGNTPNNKKGTQLSIYRETAMPRQE